MPDAHAHAHLRLATFADARTSLDAWAHEQDGDDVHLHFPLGSILEPLIAHAQEEEVLPMWAVYDREDMIAVLVRSPNDNAWQLGSPHGVVSSLSPSSTALARAVAALIVPAVFAVDDTAIDKVMGPRVMVDALIDAWVAHLTERGKAVQKLPPFLVSKVCRATRDSVLALPASPPTEGYVFERAREADEDALVQLHIEFFNESGPSHTHLSEVEARRMVRARVGSGWVWVARRSEAEGEGEGGGDGEGEIVGYVAVGRDTPRTMGVRNVFVSQAHRRKGVGAAMVQAVVRFYLGLDGEEVEQREAKEEVCLNVASEDVERVYTRCGFQLGAEEEGSGWFHSVFRGVEYV